jgi:hypothetical protein
VPLAGPEVPADPLGAPCTAICSAVAPVGPDAVTAAGCGQVMMVPMDSHVLWLRGVLTQSPSPLMNLSTAVISPV